MLQRTQILLDQQTKLDLESLAGMKNQSISSLVRQMLKEKLKEEKKKMIRKKKKMTGVEVLLAMAEEAKKIAKKYGASGPRDLSINHDHYLYGAPKKKNT